MLIAYQPPVSSASPMTISPLFESYFRRASAKLEEAKRQMKDFHFDTSVSASQESIELSVKGIFLMFVNDFKPEHKISADDFHRLRLSIPPELSSYIDVPRVWFINKLWADLYQIAKYGSDKGEPGSDKFKVGADRILKQDEAEFALRHADEVNRIAQSLRYSSFMQRKR